MLLERWQAWSTIDDLWKFWRSTIHGRKKSLQWSTIYDRCRFWCFVICDRWFSNLRSTTEVRCRDRWSLMTWSMIAIDFNDRRSTVDDRQKWWSRIDTASRSTIDMLKNPQVTFCNIISKTKVFFANKFECVTFSGKVTSKRLSIFKQKCEPWPEVGDHKNRSNETSPKKVLERDTRNDL